MGTSLVDVQHRNCHVARFDVLAASAFGLSGSQRQRLLHRWCEADLASRRRCADADKLNDRSPHGNLSGAERFQRRDDGLATTPQQAHQEMLRANVVVAEITRRKLSFYNHLSSNRSVSLKHHDSLPTRIVH